MDLAKMNEHINILRTYSTNRETILTGLRELFRFEEFKDSYPELHYMYLRIREIYPSKR